MIIIIHSFIIILICSAAPAPASAAEKHSRLLKHESYENHYRLYLLLYLIFDMLLCIYVYIFLILNLCVLFMCIILFQDALVNFVQN